MSYGKSEAIYDLVTFHYNAIAIVLHTVVQIRHTNLTSLELTNRAEKCKYTMEILSTHKSLHILIPKAELKD